MPNKPGENHDTPLIDLLYALAAPQCGLLTASQAVQAGIARSSLEYHARPTGQLERCARGLYRLRRFPPGKCTQIWRAYLPVASAGAVVSHVSALWLHGLHDRPPDRVHLTLPRSERWRSPPPGVRLHFSATPPTGARVRVNHGLPTSAPEVAIVAAIRDQGLRGELELAATLALIRGHTSLRLLRAEWPSTLLHALDRIGNVADAQEGAGPPDRTRASPAAGAYPRGRLGTAPPIG